MSILKTLTQQRTNHDPLFKQERKDLDKEVGLVMLLEPKPSTWDSTEKASIHLLVVTMKLH